MKKTNNSIDRHYENKKAVARISNVQQLFISLSIFLLFHRRLIKSPIEILRLNHIHNHMWVFLSHQCHNIRHLVGGEHGVKQVHLLVAVTAHGIHTGNSVAVVGNIGSDYRFRLGGGNLERHPLIPVMEGRYGPCRDILEQYRIPGVNPAKNKSKYTENQHIPRKHILPDRAPGLVGHIQRDKVRTARGRIAAITIPIPYRNPPNTTFSITSLNIG